MEIFKKTSFSLWKNIAHLVKESVVFIDNSSAECLHWCGGVDLLFENGAICVKEFSSFESGNSSQGKAVFILNSPLTDEYEITVKDIVKSSSFVNCVVICGLDSEVHQYALTGQDSNEDYLQEFSSKVSNWIGKGCSVEVLHLPIFMAPVAKNVFVTPAFDTIFPTQERDLGHLELPDGVYPPKSLHDLHFYMYPKEYRTLLRMVACSFRSFFHDLQCKEEIFALGSTSKLLSVQLSNISNRSKTSYPNKIGVLFVDRTQDLMSAVSHSDKTLIDQLLGVLPGLPCHFNNISIDMSLLCEGGKQQEDWIYSGCLVPDSKQHSILAIGIDKKPSEAIDIIMEKLVSALEDEGIEDYVSDDFNPSENMKKMVQAFQGNPGGILYNSVLLQFATAIVQLLDDPVSDIWEKMVTEEKLILQQLGEDNKDIVRNLTRLVDTNDIGFQDFCSLLIYASFALSGEINPNSYDTLCRILQKVLEATDYSSLSESFIATFNLQENDWTSSSRLSYIADKVMKTITELKVNTLQDFKTLKLGNIEPPSHHPLLPQVVERIFNAKKPELQPDIEHITTGRKDLLKMGISMFRKVTPPRPNEFPVLVIYVVGGITTFEVTQINKVLERYPTSQCQVVIGSNRLISPSDVVDAVLFDDNLHPQIHN